MVPTHMSELFQGLFTLYVLIMKGGFGVLTKSKPFACLSMIQCTLGKSCRNLLHDLQRPMVQATQYFMPQLTNILALHNLYFQTQCSTVVYLQHVEIIYSNPNPLGLSSNDMPQEYLSFNKDYIIAFIFQHRDKHKILLQTQYILYINSGERSSILPLKHNRTFT